MVAFRLRYEKWETLSDRNSEQGPTFLVHTEATEHPLIIRFLVSHVFKNLQQEIVFQQETRLPNNALQTAVVRFAVAQIAQGLKDGRFLPLPPSDFHDLYVEDAELPAIRQLLQEKTCDYQIRQGRDLLCAVASQNDPTRRGEIGLQTVAPTSRVLCHTCELPDTDYVCSHLMHPEVLGRADRGILQSRELLGALCDLGKPEIHHPAKCHAGGHACWERLIEQELDRPAIPISPLTLPEAFDYLDVCWRLAFGKKRPLIRLKNLTEVAMLSLPCATRDELSTRLSAVADMLKLLDIPDTLLPDPSIEKDKTLDRLQACLQRHLEAAEAPACEHALNVLRAVNRLRVVFQHSATAPELPALCARLSLPYPLSPWGETWDRIRGTVTEALGVIREAIRRYADAGTGTSP